MANSYDFTVTLNNRAQPMTETFPDGVGWAAAKSMVEAKYGAGSVSFFKPSPGSNVGSSVTSVHEDTLGSGKTTRTQVSQEIRKPSEFETRLGMMLLANVPTLGVGYLAGRYTYQTLHVENFYVYATLIALAALTGFAAVVLAIRLIPRWAYSLLGTVIVLVAIYKLLGLSQFNWHVGKVSSMSNSDKQTALLVFGGAALAVGIAVAIIIALFHANHKVYSRKFGWHAPAELANEQAE